MLETWFCPTLGKRKTDWANIRGLLFYPLKKVGQTVGKVKFLCQGNDVAAFSCAKVIPKVAVCIHLKGRLVFLSQW